MSHFKKLNSYSQIRHLPKSTYLCCQSDFLLLLKMRFFSKFCSTKNREITRADIEFWEFLNLSSIAKKEELRNWWIICHDLRDNKYYFHALETTENELCSSRADDLAHNQSPLWRQKEKVKENCKSSKSSSLFCFARR